MDSMIFIDAREGVSGDMLLAAMIGLLDRDKRQDAIKRLTRASEEQGLGFKLLELEDQGEAGLGITYLQPEPASHGVSYDEAFELLEKIERDLGPSSDTGRKILESIFKAEAEAHGAPARQVHLHEMGRPQAMMNIAGIGMLASELLAEGAQGFSCSTITTGKGIVVVSHGAVRVPAPATAILLKGLRHEPGLDPGERATPTAIAAIKVLASSQTDKPPQKFSKRSVGYGTKRFGDRLGRTVLIWP